MTQRCVSCGHPCEAALFSSSLSCTNPKCKWFHPEAKEIMAEFEENERKMREVFKGLP